MIRLAAIKRILDWVVRFKGGFDVSYDEGNSIFDPSGSYD